MSNLNLRTLGSTGEMSSLIRTAEKLGSLVECIVQHALPGHDLPTYWLYGEGGRVGLSVDVIAMATSVAADEIRRQGEYIEDLEKGALFIGYPWPVHSGAAEAKAETLLAIDIEGLPYVLLELERAMTRGEFIHALREAVVQELSKRAGELLDAMNGVQGGQAHG